MLYSGARLPRRRAYSFSCLVKSKSKLQQAFVNAEKHFRLQLMQSLENLNSHTVKVYCTGRAATTASQRPGSGSLAGERDLAGTGTDVPAVDLPHEPPLESSCHNQHVPQQLSGRVGPADGLGSLTSQPLPKFGAKLQGVCRQLVSPKEPEFQGHDLLTACRE